MRAIKGVPVGVRTGGDLWQELAYDNDWSVMKYKRDAFSNAPPDVALARAMVSKRMDNVKHIQGLRISPVGMIHDLTFEGPRSVCG